MDFQNCYDCCFINRQIKLSDTVFKTGMIKLILVLALQFVENKAVLHQSKADNINSSPVGFAIIVLSLCNKKPRRFRQGNCT